MCFEILHGDLKGYFSIRINDRYRIIFQWTGQEFIENVVLNRSKAQRTIYPSSNLFRVLRKLQGDATNAPAPPSLNKTKTTRRRRKNNPKRRKT
ncbi:MAG: type II toxin-antitoxin system RelE/ParE family toxin [Chlamydiales bacterium]